LRAAAYSRHASVSAIDQADLTDILYHRHTEIIASPPHDLPVSGKS
jgi:hypothetical protein